MKKINIGVTGTGSLIGQAIIKSLKLSDLIQQIKIIGFDYFNNTIGSFWCEKNYILPDILKKNNREEWQKNILKIIKEEEISVLFIGVDFELLLFAEYKDEIEKITGCKVIVSDEQVLTIGNDKFLTYEFLKKHNLNYPKTYLSSELNTANINYPCILKPRVGYRSKGVYVIKNEKDLNEKISLVEKPIIQELIGDEDSEYTCGILYFGNKTVNSIALHRYLKEGNTHIAEYKKDFPKIIYDYIENIALNLKPFGPCNLQLRLNKQGEPYLFEINPRYSGTTYIRSLLGFREVEYVLKYLLNYSPEPFNLKEGKVYRYFEEKLLENN